MPVNWGLAGNSGGFQNALSTGLQIGQSLRKSQDERTTRNALGTILGAQGGTSATTAAPGTAAAAPANTDAAWGDLTKTNPELALRLRGQIRQDQQGVVKIEADKRKAALDSIPTQIGMLQQASPENWQALRQQAIGLGLGSEQTLPAQFDPNWRDSQVKILSAFREAPDLMTTEVKNVLASLPPEQRDINNPAFIAAYTRAAEKVIPLQAGGSAIAYNQNTGESRPLIAANPGGMPVGAPVAAPTAPSSKVIGGKTYYQHNGKWYDEPVGGGDSNVTGNFPGH